MLDTLCHWLEKVGDERSFVGMQQLVQEYILLTLGKRVPSLREYLRLPHVAEPVEVTRCVRYWQEVWERKEVCGANVRLFRVRSWEGGRRRPRHIGTPLVADLDDATAGSPGRNGKGAAPTR